MLRRKIPLAFRILRADLNDDERNTGDCMVDIDILCGETKYTLKCGFTGFTWELVLGRKCPKQFF
jgi:hypothetical protein